MKKNSNNLFNCFICLNNKWKRKFYYEKILGLIEKFKIYECSNCKLKRLHPQLSINELDKLYSQQYFDQEKAIDKSLITNVAKYKDTIIERKKKYSYTIELLMKLHPKASSLLDVGAGTADFLKIVENHNLNTYGIEYSSFAIKKALNLNKIKLHKIALQKIQSKSFDIIHLNHVFEHFNDPQKELKELIRILKNDGLIYIEIPYQFHLIEKLKHKFFKSKINFSIHSIHHPFFYNVQNIKKLMKSYKLDIIHFEIFSSKRYQNINSKIIIKVLLWKILSIFNIGNYIEIIVKKNVS